ncbi:MAG: threonine ammonia-lyase, biosynthetic [Cellvibrionales bacterium]|nr:threonine ammonia-lyase, biosynthetic [Cellvibrionales bacterium]
MPADYIKKILAARIYDLVQETPLDPAPILSQRLGNRILLKREDLQPVFSFKIRGAYNRLLNLSKPERTAGVIAASAGNHAQGVALSARHLNIAATIVMPRTAPQIKVAAVQSHGAKVVLHGDTYDQASTHARELASAQGLTHIHPFDDPDVIAGQGTVGVEILRQCPEQLDAIFVAVGGGGLCAGIATYVKYIRPQVKIIAVEPADAACLELALRTGRRRTLKQVGLFADGAAIAQIGRETFRLLKDQVDAVLTVSTDEICAAIKDTFEDTRSIVEPAGALSLAGIKKYVQRENCQGQTLVGINCGANMNFDRLRYISERTETGEKREAVLAVTIPEKPGSFKRFCRMLSSRSITEFNYRYAAADKAHIFVGVQIQSEQDRAALIQALDEAGYPVLDLTDNEMAKLHIRYMVGGHASAVSDEQVYRFEFPERPGALMQFLTALGSRWNISMFHYRNHGAAYGRVLLGMQVPVAERTAVSGILNDLGYPFWEETTNPAYRLFLS